MALSVDQNLSSIMVNFRPLVGNKDKYVFYRSGSPHNLEGEKLKCFLNLGIRTIFDLRSPFQREKNPSTLLPYYSFFEYNDVEDTWTSVSSPEDGMEKGAVYGVSFLTNKVIKLLSKQFNVTYENDYEIMIEQGKRKSASEILIDLLDLDSSIIRAIMKVICEKSPEKVCPVLFHCSLGKDRTGILSAIINQQLGCSNETIIQEYAKTEECLQPIWKELKAMLAAHGASEDTLRSFPATMQSFLDYFTEKYGGIIEFMKAKQIPTLQQM